MSEDHKSSSAAGSFFGIVVFIVGIGLIALTFKMALEMFNVDPKTAFELGKDKAIELGRVVPTLLGIVVRVLLLCVMAMIGGMVANRGIRLYVDSRAKSAAPK
ncbi:MAG: hypothetical protein ABL949_00545 [Fimbriimonadaceae bacterium]